AWDNGNKRQQLPRAGGRECYEQRPGTCQRRGSRRYSTMTTNPVPQPGHSLVSCELHIGEFTGFEQSMNWACTFIWSLLSPEASPQVDALPLPLPHCRPNILAVAKPVTVGLPLIGAPQL